MPWVEKKDVIGGVMFLSGVGILVGWFLSDKVHGVEKFAIVASVLLMILGAHFMSSGPTEEALKTVGRTVKDVLPFTKKDSGPPPPEPPAGEV